MVLFCASHLPALQLPAGRGWAAREPLCHLALLSDRLAPSRHSAPPVSGLPFQSDRLPSRLSLTEPWLTALPPAAGVLTSK